MSTPPYVGLPTCARSLRLPVDGGELAGVEALPETVAPVSTALLVPGFTGSKEDFVAVLEPLASRGHRVVALDQRGQHESTHAPGPDGYALKTLAADVLAVVDHLGAGPVHLLGHSLGGLVAREAALAQPGAFRSVTLLASGPAAIGPPRADSLRLLLDALPQMSLPQVWDAMRALDSAKGLPRATAEVEAFLQRRFLGNDPVGLAVMADVLLTETDRVSELQTTGLPLHVCYGEEDDAWPPQVQGEMAAQLGAACTVLPHAAHSPAAEAPEAAAEALSGFWAEVDAAWCPLGAGADGVTRR